MKKLMTSMTLSLGLLIGSAASASDTCLSIALNNLSTAPVEFSTAADPGDLSEVNVNVGDTVALPADFMSTCSDQGCTIMVFGSNQEITTIGSVKQGTLIRYYSGTKYTLETTANAQCP